MMARTKAYSRQQALENAATLFWKQGYTATSVQQLLNTMGINRSSMYTEFGSKRDIFLEVMELYRSWSRKLIDAISEATDPVQAVREFYTIGFEKQSQETLNKGCLLINSILELREVDSELCTLASQYIDELENAFANCFQKCISLGTLTKEHDPVMLAGYIMTVIKGMRVAARQAPDANYLRGVLEMSILVFNKNQMMNIGG